MVTQAPFAVVKITVTQDRWYRVSLVLRKVKIRVCTVG